MGVMTSYGSYNKTTQPVILNSLLICIINSSVSFISGLVVWSVIGYLRHIDSPVSSKTSSIGLAFIAYPTAISKMELPWLWSFLLFGVIFLLGIDSAFALVEAPATVICDALGPQSKVKRWMITLVLCVFGFVGSIFFCLDIGLYLLDVIDHYVNVYIMLFIGVLECIGVGWFY